MVVMRAMRAMKATKGTKQNKQAKTPKKAKKDKTRKRMPTWKWKKIRWTGNWPELEQGYSWFLSRQ